MSAVPPWALVITGIVSVQVGAGLAGRMFGEVSPATLTGLRLWAAAAAMAAFGGRGVAGSIRDLVRERAWRDSAVVVAFGVTLAIMNFSFYQAIARIPLGIAVTIEFLGPLAVAVASSRRLVDLIWVALAGTGVALLSDSAWALAAGTVRAWLSRSPRRLALLGGTGGLAMIAIGTRLARGARVIRGPKREIISRCYNLLLHATLGTRFSDAQCGFKAIRACQARQLLPLVADSGWFFDTELLVLAERAGLRIHEVPVDWTDDTDSRVDIVDTALRDLHGMARVGLGLVRGTIKVPPLALRESVYAKSAALTAPGPTASHSLGGRR